MSRAFTRRGVLASIAVLTIATVCVRLGFWQLDRLEQRRARNEITAARLAEPALEGTRALADTTGLSYRRIVLDGRLDRQRTLVLARRAYRGTPGVHVLVPFRDEPGVPGVLLDLGWLPSADAARVDLERVDLPARIRVTGMVLPLPDRPPERLHGDERADPPERAPRILYRLDAATLGERLPYPMAPLYVRALPEAGAPGVPTRIGPPATSEGPHLGYALQWFGFALVAVIGWGVMVFRRERNVRLPERT